MHYAYYLRVINLLLMNKLWINIYIYSIKYREYYIPQSVTLESP